MQKTWVLRNNILRAYSHSMHHRLRTPVGRGNRASFESATKDLITSITILTRGSALESFFRSSHCFCPSGSQCLCVIITDPPKSYLRLLPAKTKAMFHRALSEMDDSNNLVPKLLTAAERESCVAPQDVLADTEHASQRAYPPEDEPMDCYVELDECVYEFGLISLTDWLEWHNDEWIPTAVMDLLNTRARRQIVMETLMSAASSNAAAAAGHAGGAHTLAAAGSAENGASRAVSLSDEDGSIDSACARVLSESGLVRSISSFAGTV